MLKFSCRNPFVQIQNILHIVKKTYFLQESTFAQCNWPGSGFATRGWLLQVRTDLFWASWNTKLFFIISWFFKLTQFGGGKRLLQVKINLIWTWWQIKLFLEILKVKTLTQAGNRRSEQPKLFDPFTTFIKPSWEPVWRGVGDPWDLLKFTRKPLTKKEKEKKEACKIEIGFQHRIYVSPGHSILNL